MIKERPENMRVWQQAELMWQILTAFVMFPDTKKKQQTITYGELAKHMGYETPNAGHTLGRPLGLIGTACLRSSLPPLNVIVVTRFGQPGDEVIVRRGSTVEEDQEAVRQTKWFRYRPPSAAAFRSVWEDRGRREVVRVGQR